MCPLTIFIPLLVPSNYFFFHSIRILSIYYTVKPFKLKITGAIQGKFVYSVKIRFETTSFAWIYYPGLIVLLKAGVNSLDITPGYRFLSIYPRGSTQIIPG